jgi:hypothetical protein
MKECEIGTLAGEWAYFTYLARLSIALKTVNATSRKRSSPR